MYKDIVKLSAPPLHHIVHLCMVLVCTVLVCMVLVCMVLVCMVLVCTVLVCMVLVCMVLVCMVLVRTDTNMYGSQSCYRHVPVLQYSYCTRFESSLSLYQCTLLPICTVATVQLLYAFRILTVTI
jgi:hypothetical protein